MSRVFVPIPISGIEEEKEQPSLTYKLDLDTGRIVGKVDGLDLWRMHSSATAGFLKSMTLSLSSTRIPATSTSRRTLFTGPQRSRR